jgi:biopolymer transport protein TolR
MAASHSDSDEMITGINVTPLVDVVLVLLVIFMITAPVIYQGAIKVELPKAASGDKTEHITMKFSLLLDGGIRLGNDSITSDKVPALIKQAIDQDPTANAIVAADRNLAHGTVVSFIDMLKTNGMNRFGIAVESPNAR